MALEGGRGGQPLSAAAAISASTCVLAQVVLAESLEGREDLVAEPAWRGQV